MSPWLIIVGIMLVFGVLFYLQRRKKAADKLKPHPWTVYLDRFTPAHIPYDVDRATGRQYAADLKDAYLELWENLGNIYEKKNPPPSCVTEIMLTHSEVLPDHPHVVWYAPHGPIGLRIQPGMGRWYAGEMHNVFRYQLYGMGRIYLDDYEPTPREVEQYADAVAFINEAFKE